MTKTTVKVSAKQLSKIIREASVASPREDHVAVVHGIQSQLAIAIDRLDSIRSALPMLGTVIDDAMASLQDADVATGDVLVALENV